MLFWICVAAFIAPVFLQAFFAYKDSFLTSRQVLRHWGEGLPFLFHGGMWGDVFIVAWLMAYIIDRHHAAWTTFAMSLALVAGLLASEFMHEKVYTAGGIKIPEAHTHDGKLTAAGHLHSMYMGVGFAVLGLYYFATPGLGSREVWTVSGVLFAHMVIGTHIPFKIWVTLRRPRWYPKVPILDTAGALTLTGVGALLVAASVWALR